MSASMNADKAVQTKVRAGQWSAVREKEKPMEEMSLGELLFKVLVGEEQGVMPLFQNGNN